MRYYNPLTLINNQTYTTATTVPVPNFDNAEQAEFFFYVSNLVGSPTCLDVRLEVGYNVGGTILYSDDYTLFTTATIIYSLAVYRGAIENLQLNLVPIAGTTSFTISISLRIFGT
jgi:hypothetical protein